MRAVTCRDSVTNYGNLHRLNIVRPPADMVRPGAVNHTTTRNGSVLPEEPARRAGVSDESELQPKAWRRTKSDRTRK
jgi:hypothetical protein